MHFKNTRESAMAIRSMELNKAKRYLEDVLAHKRVIPFRRFCGGVGRTAQVGNSQVVQCSKVDAAARSFACLLWVLVAPSLSSIEHGQSESRGLVQLAL